MINFQEVPSVNGVMDFTEEEVLHIRKKLDLIKDSFVPDINTQTLTSQYVVSKYNEESIGNELNGDTATFILGYMTEEEQLQETPVTE